MISVDKILQFWFEGITDQTPIDKRALPFRKWFAKDERLDAEIKETFEAQLILARGGQCREWENSFPGRLALIILFDQFSRNMYRGTAKMFETDSLALDLSLRSIEEKIDGEWQLIERIFLYLPLMHSEDSDIQKLSLRCFEKLAGEAKHKFPQNVSYYEYNFFYAQKYCSVIEQFGRFPHRNIFLARISTVEESAFLRRG